MNKLPYALTSTVAVGALVIGLAGTATAQSTGSLMGAGSTGSLGELGSSENQTMDEALLMSALTQSNDRVGYQRDSGADRVADSFANRARSGEFTYNIAGATTVRDRGGLAYIYQINHGSVGFWMQTLSSRDLEPAYHSYGVGARSDAQFVYLVEFFPNR